MTDGPRILILKLGALGDVVMASTLVPAILARWPAAKITWVVDEALAPIVRRFDGVTEVVAVPAEALLRGGMLTRARALLTSWWRIGAGVWDEVLVCHSDARYGVVVRATRARVRRHFRSVEAGAAAGLLRRRWMGDEYADLLRATRVDAPQPPEMNRPLPTLRGGPRHSPAILLAPGGARNVLRNDALRRWPIGHWVAVAEALVSSGHDVTLIGGSGDVAEADAIRRAVPGVVDRVGRESVSETLDRIAAARLLLTHDSGPLHLAIMTGTPTIALFGPTRPEERIPAWAPVRVVSAAAGLPCAPCYDGFGYARCAFNRCLADVPPTAVLDAVTAMLQGSASPSTPAS